MEEETLELLRQVDVSRHARRMEQLGVVRRTKNRGAQELKESNFF